MCVQRENTLAGASSTDALELTHRHDARRRGVPPARRPLRRRRQPPGVPAAQHPRARPEQDRRKFALGRAVVAADADVRPLCGAGWPALRVEPAQDVRHLAQERFLQADEGGGVVLRVEAQLCDQVWCACGPRFFAGEGRRRGVAWLLVSVITAQNGVDGVE